MIGRLAALIVALHVLVLGVASVTGEEASIVINGCELRFRGNCPAAKLAEADLRGRYASMADLSGADLRGANLSNLNLWKTRLSKADLSGANLSGAFLTGADLQDANLQGADLRQAFLFRAQADGANFQGALLEGARWLTGAICGPGSVGKCLPISPIADYDPPPLTSHLQH